MSVDILPLDFSASKTTNKKIELVNPVNPINKGYVICPEWGAFYSDTLIIRDKNNLPLVKGKDYNVAYLYEEYTLLSANEVMGLILIDNKCKPPFSITAQYVGGPLFSSIKQVKEAIENVLDEAKFKFSFWDILNRPTEFIPSKHRHDMWQLLGMSSTVSMVEKINVSLKQRFNGINPLIKPLSNYLEDVLLENERKLEQLVYKANEHYSNWDNPHQDTRSNTNTGNLANYQLASNHEAIDKNCDYRYQTAYGVYTQLKKGKDFGDHISQPNPHNTTINDLGGLTKAQWDAKFNNYLRLAPPNNMTANSQRLEGNTLDDIYMRVGVNLDASLYNNDVLEPRLLGNDYDQPHLSVLCADQQYRSLSQMFNNYPVNKNQLLALGYFDNISLAEDYLNRYHGESPESTVAMCNIKDTYSLDYLKSDLMSPLDPISKKIGELVIFVRHMNQWVKH